MKGNKNKTPVIVELLKDWTNDCIIVSGTGHRPKYTTVKGKAPYPQNTHAYERLVSCAKFALEKVQASRVITGGALGWDMALAEACFQLKLYHILAQPHEEHLDSFTIEETKKYYETIMERSDEVISVSKGGYSVEKLDIRNNWMIDNSHLVVALWNGQASGTGNAVSYATNQFVPVVNFWSDWESYKER
jgi:uncharacterized phage-like protein YoqJ